PHVHCLARGPDCCNRTSWMKVSSRDLRSDPRCCVQSCFAVRRYRRECGTPWRLLHFARSLRIVDCCSQHTHRQNLSPKKWKYWLIRSELQLRCVTCLPLRSGCHSGYRLILQTEQRFPGSVRRLFPVLFGLLPCLLTETPEKHLRFQKH